jgi:hypothetical protein
MLQHTSLISRACHAPTQTSMQYWHSVQRYTELAAARLPSGNSQCMLVLTESASVGLQGTQAPRPGGLGPAVSHAWHMKVSEPVLLPHAHCHWLQVVEDSQLLTCVQHHARRQLNFKAHMRAIGQADTIQVVSSRAPTRHTERTPESRGGRAS